uniref:Nuclear receptor n=1 Tax=Brachionus calyciflorus TaxID=104777 RepID=A0A221CB06_9BILA|nr:nuclear receptor [Brachionus calyciflorus]
MNSNDCLDEKIHYLNTSAQMEHFKTTLDQFYLEISQMDPPGDINNVKCDLIETSNKKLKETEKILVNTLVSLYHFSRSINPIDLNVESKLMSLRGQRNRLSSVKIKAILANFLSIPIKRVITFAKMLPDFIELDQNDQLNLIQAGTLEITICSSSSMYDREMNKFENLISKENHVQNSDNLKLEFLKRLWTEDLYEKTVVFLKSINDFNLGERGLVIFLILILFSPDRPRLINRNKIEKIQSKFSFLLEKYMIWKDGLNETTKKNYSNVLLRLRELRELAEMHSSLILDADLSALEPFPLAFISNKKEESSLVQRTDTREEPLSNEL